MTWKGLTAPLERSAELQQLAAVLSAAAGGRGQVCVIEGPSGVGKSRLLDECAESAQAQGMLVLRARCSELTRDYPFGVSRNLFESTLISADAGTRTKMMRGPAALAEPIFGHGEASDGFGIVHGLYWLTVNMAEQQPMAILVDDLPWADDSSLRCLAYIAERLDDMPVAIIVTVRSGDPAADSELVSHLWEATTSPPIRPAELTEHAVETLLAATLPGRDVDARLTREVVRQTGGNPFLVVAVADAIRAGDDPDVNTPESIRRRVARRLVRLGPAARDLAGAASVLGDDAELRDGLRLAGLEGDRGLAAAEELVGGHIFRSADPILFAHPIVRMAVYSLQAPGERLALHAGAARLLADYRAAPEIVAEHLLMSGPIREKWAQAALHDAGRAAARKGAPAAAIRYLHHAIDGEEADELAPRVLIDLGLAEAAAGEPMSLSRFEHALNLITEPGERADALYSLGQTLYRFGRYADAAVTFHRGAQLFNGHDRPIRLRFEGAAWGAEAHLTPTQPGPESSANGDGPGTRGILAVQALRESLTTPPASRAGDLALAAMADGALLAEQGSQGPGVHLATLALLHCGHLPEAQEAADASVRDACDHGAQLAYAEASVVRALIGYARGRIGDAAADAQAAVDILRHRGHAHMRTARAVLAHCLIERGELTEAQSLFDHADVDISRTPAINGYVCLARARMNLRRNDIDAARRDLDIVEHAVRDLGIGNPAVLAWRSLAGVITYLSGDEARGHALIQEEIRLAQTFGLPIPLGIALQRRAFTERGEQALATLREAVNVLAQTEAVLELARAHAALGRGLRRDGQRVDARSHLTIGLDLAHRCGATGVEADIREELTAAGARPRRLSVTGVESLTPTELRVARLAAQGRSNREIAEQIFVSRSTIAWHLRNIYRKLQIDSRQQLPPHIDC
jgi:DNA-binding CsgD family transcriptional regulator